MDRFNEIIDSKVSDSAKLFNRIRLVKSVVGDNSTIGDDCDIVNLKMQDKTELGRRNIIRDTTLGRGSYTGTNTIIKNSDIGKFCCISWNVSIGGGNHDYGHTSMYTDYWFNRNFDIVNSKAEESTIRTRIGNDVWIGAGAIINNGIIIGDGCVIGAGAVITKDIPSWSVAVGIPGRVIKMRFDNKVSAALEKLRWWDWNDEMIVEYHDLLTSNPTEEQIYAVLEKLNV